MTRKTDTRTDKKPARRLRHLTGTELTQVSGGKEDVPGVRGHGTGGGDTYDG